MESEKVKEIKKALECCCDIKEKCDNKRCYLFDKLEYHYCERQLKTDILTLINDLESENERLNKSDTSKEESSIEYYNLYKDLKRKNKDLNELCELQRVSIAESFVRENQLKDLIAELEKEKTCVWEEWTDGYHSIWCCSNCKEDFCFMEGDVYENNYGYCPHCGAKITALKELQEDDIDETLKEFL